MKKLIFLLLFISNSNSAQVLGYFDSIYYNNHQLHIKGWACEKGVNKSINVNAYVELEDEKEGMLLSTSIANKFVNAKISQRCNTTATPHRYIIKIPENIANKYAGKRINVFGVKASDGLIDKKALKLVKSNKALYVIPSITSTTFHEVDELHDFNFHPLQYFSHNKQSFVTNSKVYNRRSKSVINDDKFSLKGAHSIATSGEGDFFAVNTAVIERGKHNKLRTDKNGKYILRRQGSLVQFNQKEVIARHNNKFNYPLFSPHDITYNKVDNYYYFVDSHWYSPADYLVRFQYIKGEVSNHEVIKLNHLYPGEKIYTRSLSLYKKGNIQKIMIGVSSHGEVIVVDSFSKGLGNSNFSIKKVIDPGRQQNIDKIAPTGAYSTTGFVFNDVEYFKGYFYATNHYSKKSCSRAGCSDSYRLIRWQNWDEFEKGNVEDLSQLIQKKRIPYYLSNVAGKLYVTTIPDNSALKKDEKLSPKIYVLH